MRPRFSVPVILLLLLLNHGLFAQNLLINGSLERLDGADPLYDELPPGSTDILGWTVGAEGGIDGIRSYWPASAGRDSVDLTHGVLGPGSIFQDVTLTKGKRYRVSFDMARNTDLGLPVAVEVSIGGVTNIFTRSVYGFPFWQRQSFVFTARKTGIARLTFAEQRTAETGANETALDNIVLEIDASSRAQVYLLGRGEESVLLADVSDNGRVVVGRKDNFKKGPTDPIRWTRGTGLKPIKVPDGGGFNNASGVSSNGALIVGVINKSANVGDYDRGFRWTKQTGAVEIGTNLNNHIWPRGVSGDGRVIFGEYWAFTNLVRERPFRWTLENGFEPLNTLGGAVGQVTLSEPSAMAVVTDGTYDGSVLVGNSETSDGKWAACRWRSSSVNPEYVDTSGVGNSFAQAVNSGGTVIVGSWWQAEMEAQRMCRWTSMSGSREILDTNATYHSSFATDVSADGERIVGSASRGPGEITALLWTEEDGLKSLDERFSGVLPSDWIFIEAMAISANGRWIIGRAYDVGRGDAAAFILDTGRVPRRE